MDKNLKDFVEAVAIFRKTWVKTLEKCNKRRKKYIAVTGDLSSPVYGLKRQVLHTKCCCNDKEIVRHLDFIESVCQMDVISGYNLFQQIEGINQILNRVNQIIAASPQYKGGGFISSTPLSL